METKIIDKKISVLESYERYKALYPRKNKSKGIENTHSYHLNKQVYNKIIKALGEELSFEMITTGKMFQLPNRLGFLQIVKYKPKHQKVDFAKTRKVYGEYNRLHPKNKKSVKHLNRITKGYLSKVCWFRGLNNQYFKNQTKYTFKFTRPNLRPNSYNNNNPRISLIPFFQEEGFRMYETYNRDTHGNLRYKT